MEHRIQHVITFTVGILLRLRFLSFKGKIFNHRKISNFGYFFFGLKIVIGNFPQSPVGQTISDEPIHQISVLRSPFHHERHLAQYFHSVLSLPSYYGTYSRINVSHIRQLSIFQSRLHFHDWLRNRKWRFKKYCISLGISSVITSCTLNQ